MRIPNWQSALSEYITRCARIPFRYGQLDCGLFVAGAIETLTGLDVASELRGQYTSRTEAFERIRALCGTATMEAVAQFLAERHRFVEVPVLMAQRGDAVVLKSGRRSTLGIVDMNPGYILTPYKDGLLRLPLSQASRAYRIG